jgi:hypothetical protein
MLVWAGGKEPNEIADFDIDWSLRLAADTIVSSAWTITVGDAPATGTLAIQSTSFIATRTKVWLTAGNAGVIYTLKNTVTTANGDTLIEEVQILVAVR